MRLKTRQKKEKRKNLITCLANLKHTTAKSCSLNQSGKMAKLAAEMMDASAWMGSAPSRSSDVCCLNFWYCETAASRLPKHIYVGRP